MKTSLATPRLSAAGFSRSPHAFFPTLRSPFFILFFALLAALPAQATLYQWVGSAGNGNMTGTNASYSPSGAPVTGDTISWNATTYTAAPTANGNMTIGELWFGGNNTGNVTFGAGTSVLTLNADGATAGVGIQMDSGSLAVSTNGTKFALGGNQTWLNNSVSLLTVNGTITNSGASLDTLTVAGSGNTTLGVGAAISNGTGTLALTKNGAGTLTLAAANTYTGPTTINAGTLKVSATASSNAFGGNGTIIIGDAANTGAAATLEFNSANSFPAFSNAINIVGNGTSTISATSWSPVFNGNVTLSNNLNILANNNSGSFLTFNGTLAGTGNVQVTVQNGSSSSYVTFNGNVNNVGTLTFNNISYSGNKTNTITGGVGSNVTGIFQNSTNSPLTISGGALQVNAGGTTLGGNGTALFTISSAITGAGGITKSGTGNLTLSGNNTFTGGVTLNAGLLNINNNGALGGPGNTFTINGGSINNTFTGAVIAQNNPVNIGADFIFVGGTNDLNFGNGSVTLNGTAGSRAITVNAGTLTFGGVVANGTASGLTKSGAGSLTLAGASSNTYTGPTTIKAGTLNVSTSSSSNAFGGNGTLIVGDASNTGAAATLNFSSNGSAFPTFTNAINIVGNGTSTISATLWNPVFSGAVTLSNNLTILSNDAAASKITFNGGITGTDNILVRVQSGNSAGSWVTFGNAAVNNIGTLTFDNVSYTGNATNSITGGVGSNVTAITQASSNSPLTISTTAIQVNSAGTTLTASGAALFTVSGGVSGTGNLTLDTNNNTSGISVTTTTINNIGTVTNSGNGTAATTISAVIGPNVTGLTQNSASSQLDLSAGNTYNGTTTITAGSLVLSGTGSINSTSGVSVATGATFTNNSSVGYNKILTLAEGATLSGTGSFAPTAMTLTANLSDGFTTIALGNLLTRANNLELTLTGITGGTYTLFSGTLNGAFQTMTVGGTLLSGSGGDFSGTVGGNAYAFTNANSQLVVTIPEPSTWALLAVSLTALRVLRRRRSS